MAELSVAIRPIWLASYPRSGNTFLRIIFQNMFRLPTYSIYRVEGQDFHDPSADALEEAPYLAKNWRDLLSDAPEAKTVLIKTHGPPTDKGKAIYLVREGCSAVDSYFHYHKKFAFDQPQLTEVIAGACQFGSWSEHYRSWQPKSRPGTLLLRYEELVNEPSACIPKLAEFVGVEPVEAKLPTFSELREKLPAFFRKGQAKEFLQEWTPGQITMFNQLHGEVMSDLGYPLPSTTEPEASTVPELARSAARLHSLYVEQLQKEGAGAVVRRELREEVARLSETVRDLSEQLVRKERTLKPLLKNRWVRFGMAVHAVKRERNGNGSSTPLHSAEN